MCFVRLQQVKNYTNIVTPFNMGEGFVIYIDGKAYWLYYESDLLTPVDYVYS